jgi:putative tricarboxylic transport membrane protein
MISYGNDWTVFFTRPISGPIMLIAALTLLYPALRRMRQEAQRRRTGPPPR